MNMSVSITKIAPALLKAQKEIGAATKGSTNPFFKSTYADLGSVMEACKKQLNDNGIVVLQPVVSDADGVYVQTTLLHESGEWISDGLKIAPKSETNPQDQGSAISYARRYGLQSMVFIPAEDDDAEKAKKVATKPAVQGGASKAPAQSGTAGTGVKKVYATPKQVQLIAILLQKKGKSDEALKKAYKVASKKDLLMSQASKIIDNLTALPDVPKQDIAAELEASNAKDAAKA